MNVMSMEDRSEGKFMGRRFILVVIAMIGLHFVVFSIIFVNPQAADGSLLTAYALAVGGVLSAYYASGYGDRSIARDLAKQDV